MRERILEYTAGRDRVIDAVKALALLLVIAGHSLAWTSTPDGLTSTLDAAPGVFPVTWALQILPLFFFVAGAGLKGLNHAGSVKYIRRAARLQTPIISLLLITAVLTTALPGVGGLGVLPVQLIWFIGVYLIILVLAPFLNRCTHLSLVIPWLGLIALIDVLRVNVSAGLGWANLIVVWAMFAFLGVNMKALRSLPAWFPGAAAIVSIAAAVMLIRMGPYSPALISTDALPGLTNLAPPTLVLAFAGIAQISILLLLWAPVSRLLSRDGVWVPIAFFSSRAMGLYVFHMLVMTVVVGLVIALAWAPSVLSPLWWGLHLLVFVVVLLITWFISPLLQKVSSVIAQGIAKVCPAIESTLARVCILLAAAACLLISEGSLAEPWTYRTVVGIPYVPIVALVIVLVTSGVWAKTINAAESP